MMAWIAVTFLAVGAAAWILSPLFRSDAAEAERLVAAVSEERDLDSRREMALAALRDLEDDRATGKIGDADYEDLKARLSARAVEILQRIESLGSAPDPRRD